MRVNHYKWLEKNFPDFVEKLLGGDAGMCCKGYIGAHGDKCYGFRQQLEDAGIPFPHGVAIYLLSHMHPYSKEVRQTPEGWVDVGDWIVKNKDRFIGLLNPIDESDPDVIDRW